MRSILVSSLTADVMVQNPSANDIMKQQEEMLKQKYGGLQPKKKLMPKVCSDHNVRCQSKRKRVSQRSS